MLYLSRGETNRMATTVRPYIGVPRVETYLNWVWLILITLSVCSCASQNPAEQINKFAQATTAVTGQTQNAYQAVQDEYRTAQIYRVVANYNTQGFNPSLLTPFLSSEQIQVRIDVLKGLNAYAQGLASLASDDQVTQFDNQTKALGQQLISLDKQEPIKGSGVSDTDMKAFATAVDALGRMLIQYKREAALKQVIHDHDGDVQTICRLFSSEIGGSAPAAGAPPPRGLRNQLWNEYTQATTAYDLFIEHQKTRMNPTDEFNAISQLATMIQQQAAGDAMLVATSQALDQLARTHSSLNQAFDTQNGGLNAMIAELQADAKNIADFYNSLNTSKK